MLLLEWIWEESYMLEDVEEVENEVLVGVLSVLIFFLCSSVLIL